MHIIVTIKSYGFFITAEDYICVIVCVLSYGNVTYYKTCPNSFLAKHFGQTSDGKQEDIDVKHRLLTLC